VPLFVVGFSPPSSPSTSTSFRPSRRVARYDRVFRATAAVAEKRAPEWSSSSSSSSRSSFVVRWTTRAWHASPSLLSSSASPHATGHQRAEDGIDVEATTVVEDDMTTTTLATTTTLESLRREIGDASSATRWGGYSSLTSYLAEFARNSKARFSRESLSKLGMSALLAYGFVSNVSGVLAISSAWFVFCKRVSFLFSLWHFGPWVGGLRAPPCFVVVADQPPLSSRTSPSANGDTNGCLHRLIRNRPRRFHSHSSRAHALVSLIPSPCCQNTLWQTRRLFAHETK
jgi:hypothetical protein